MTFKEFAKYNAGYNKGRETENLLRRDDLKAIYETVIMELGDYENRIERIDDADPAAMDAALQAKRMECCKARLSLTRIYGTVRACMALANMEVE